MDANRVTEVVRTFSELLLWERRPSIVWPIMLRELERAVGFDGGFIAASWGAASEGRGAVLEHDAPWLMRRLGRFLAEYSKDEVGRHTDQCRRYTDVWSAERMDRLSFFQEVLRPRHVRHMIVRASGRDNNIAGFQLERRGASSDFSDTDMAIVDSVAPFLHILELLAIEQPSQSTQDFAQANGLSRREAELAGWVSRGLQNKEIAMLVGLKPTTVRNTLARVFEKARVSSRAELAYLYSVESCGSGRAKASPARDGLEVFAARVTAASLRRTPAALPAVPSDAGKVVFISPLL